MFLITALTTPILHRYLRVVCRLAGHDASWTDGVANGYRRPTCTRCHARL